MLSSLRRLRALLVAGALCVPIVAVLPAAPSVAAPNECNHYGLDWTTEQDMADASTDWCRSTYVDDPGRGSLLNRAQLLQAAGLYNSEGFDNNWLWYAPETDRFFPASSTQQWTACPAGNHNGICPFGGYLPRHELVPIDFNGHAVDLHVFAWGSRFIARVCGNFGVPTDDTSDPVPVIAGHKFDDANRNGSPDTGEPGVGGVTFELIRAASLFGDQSDGVVAQTTTAGDGSFAFRLDGMGPGTYTVHEVPPAGWVSTTGLDQTVVVPDGIGSATVATLQFGNREEHPPVADAGPDQYVDQTATDGTPVTLDGGASSDADGDPLTYSWNWPAGSATGVTPTVSLPVGTTNVTLTVSDGIESSTATTAVTVYPPITGAGVGLSAVESAATSGPVAVFDDPDPGAQADEYAATIDFGDGTNPVDGVIVKGADGRFTVSGSHVYADEGDPTVTVTVTDTDNAFNSAVFRAPAAVADASLHAGEPTTVTAVEGNPTSTTVATFTDDNASAPVGDYTATIDWGDGVTSPGVVTVDAAGRFAVGGSHTYADEGEYATTTTVVDDGGSRVTVSGLAQVADAQLAANGIDGYSTNPVDRTLATFTDANPGGTTADFTATIDWGDGSTPSAGTVTGATGGPFAVSGAHTYATLGPKTVTIHIVDDGGSTATAYAHVLVFAYPASGGFVVGDGSARVGSTVTYWGAQWSNANVVSGGAAPDAFKGYESSLAGDVRGDQWNTGPGNSPAPPATVPTYMAVIVTDAVQQSGSTITGDAPRMAVVRTDLGYASAPGHVGTGTVVGFLP